MIKDRTEIRIMVLIITFMIGVYAFSAPINRSISASSIEDADIYSRNYLELYCGAFANAVPIAVNPTATMAVLSFVGMIERSDEIWPNVTWLEKPREVLGAIPLVRNAEALPTANPWMTILFTVLAIALYVVRSIKACKALSQETIDKVEAIAGQIANVCLVLLQFTQVAVANAATQSVTYRTHVTVVGVILGVIAAVICAVIYFIVSKCIAGLEAIATGIPAAATNAFSQIGKGIIHFFATLFQFISVYFAAVVGILFTILCLFLLIKFQKYAMYYKYIYINPVMRRIFRKNRKIEFLHRRFPRRAKKLFGELEYAIPIFSMKTYHKQIKARELLWLAPVQGVPSIVRVKLFKKTVAYPIGNFYNTSHILYVQKTKRFIRILTEEKDIEFIISNEYEPYRTDIMDRLRALDYKDVEQRLEKENREKKEAAKQAKREARAEKKSQKRAAREAKREEKRQQVLAKKAEKAKK